MAGTGYYWPHVCRKTSVNAILESQERPADIPRTQNVIRYQYKKPKILFVGINPHFGSFNRGVPFSNNKLFWYLLSEAGVIEEKREELRNDEALKQVYKEKFNAVYGLGLVNVIHRPTQDITKLNKGEALPGRKRISRIIEAEMPKVVCFIGKVAYEKYTGLKDFSFGWQDTMGKSRVFVIHFPLCGKAIIRVRELREIVTSCSGLN
jgi:double-stranded uracil-DNA glycosylase